MTDAAAIVTAPIPATGAEITSIRANTNEYQVYTWWTSGNTVYMVFAIYADLNNGIYAVTGYPRRNVEATIFYH